MSLDVLNAAVRPLVTLLVTLSLCGAFLIGVWRGDIKLSVDAFIGIAGMVMAFWFSQRQSVKDSAAAPAPPLPRPNGS